LLPGVDWLFAMNLHWHGCIVLFPFNTGTQFGRNFMTMLVHNPEIRLRYKTELNFLHSRQIGHQTKLQKVVGLCGCPAHLNGAFMLRIIANAANQG
jgi:hypothetical protein